MAGRTADATSGEPAGCSEFEDRPMASMPARRALDSCSQRTRKTQTRRTERERERLRGGGPASQSPVWPRDPVGCNSRLNHGASSLLVSGTAVAVFKNQTFLENATLIVFQVQPPPPTGRIGGPQAQFRFLKVDTSPVTQVPCTLGDEELRVSVKPLQDLHPRQTLPARGRRSCRLAKVQTLHQEGKIPEAQTPSPSPTTRLPNGFQRPLQFWQRDILCLISYFY